MTEAPHALSVRAAVSSDRPQAPKGPALGLHRVPPMAAHQVRFGPQQALTVVHVDALPAWRGAPWPVSSDGRPP